MCIIHPQSAEDVSRVMRAIYESGGVKYAVQAGGHTAMREWDTTDNGVLISFADMYNVSYNPSRETISLQPGVRWGEAIAYLEPLGVTPLGGRLPDVGTGLLLGGGLNYLSARHGFSVDSLVAADVVLVDGRLVTANATNEYSDLFKALKGGANRFGIVTRYEVKAIHVGTDEEKMMIGGSVVYDNSSTEALLRATANYVDNVDDPNASILVIIGATLSNNTVAPVNVITFFYNGTSLPPDTDNPYHEFLSLPYLISAIGSYSYAEANNVLGSGGDRANGQIFGASAFGSTEWDISQGLAKDKEESFEQYMKAYRAFNRFLEKAKGTPKPATPGGTPTPTPTIAPGYPFPPPQFPIFPTYPAPKPTYTNLPPYPAPPSPAPTRPPVPAPPIPPKPSSGSTTSRPTSTSTGMPKPTSNSPPHHRSNPSATTVGPKPPPIPTYTFKPSPTWSFPSYPSAPLPTYPTPSTTPRPLPPPSISFVDDPAADGISAALLAFTPVQKSQIEAGRRAGGNLMDPPLTNYALVQFHVTMPEWLGIVPKRVVEGRKEVLSELVASKGLPLYMNECDAEQNVFETYGQYEFMKEVYRKYDPTGINVRFMKGPPGIPVPPRKT